MPNRASLTLSLAEYALVKERGSYSPDEACQLLAAGLPLAHARSNITFIKLCRAAEMKLYSRCHLEELGKVPVDNDCVERELGTEDCVFTYAGPFRLDERRRGECGFVFKPQIESRHRFGTPIATPFDSGALRDYLLPSRTPDERKAFLKEHEMHAPGFREFFALYLAKLFNSPWDYVEGLSPLLRDWLPFEGGDFRRWTFEVRFVRELRCESLMAVFIPKNQSIINGVAERIHDWEKQRVDVRLYNETASAGGGDLLIEYIRYLREKFPQA